MITVSGNLFEITSSPSTAAFVRFWMRGTGGNQPFVSGTALLAPDGGNTWFSDFIPNGSGAISGNLYSTSQVTVGGSTGAIYYGMQVYQNGYAGPESPVSASGNISISTPNILTTLPVVAAPTGDSTYLRLDGTNAPVTGGVTFNKYISAGLATTTYSATPTFDASQGNTIKITLTGNVTSSTLSNAVAGQMITFVIVQDVSGAHTFVWPTTVKNAIGVSTTGSATTIQTFIFDGTNAYPIAPGTIN